MKSATITLDASGRLLVPEAIREEAGLVPGRALEIRCRSGHVEIEPKAPEIRVVEKGGVFVAVPSEPVEPLTAETVRATQKAIRDRHLEG